MEGTVAFLPMKTSLTQDGQERNTATVAESLNAWHVALEESMRSEPTADGP